jgi:hypothetical protein
MQLIRIGYWHGDRSPDMPNPADFVDPDWDEDERDITSGYLSSGTIARAYMGYSPCRLCSDRNNGDREFTDGIYIWPQGLRHYVDEHSVRLPEKFVSHAVARMEEIEAAYIDDSWWRSLRSDS